MSVVIKNARLWTGEVEYDDGCVITEGSRIIYAGTTSGAPAYQADTMINAKGGILIPALYNGHCHAAMTLLRGLGSDKPLMDWLGVINPIEDKLDNDIVYIGGMLACMEMLRRGCVCFNDMYMFMDATAQAVRDSGIRGLLGRGFTAQANLDKNIKLFEDWNDTSDGRIKIAITPYAEYGVSEELYKASVDAANKLHAPLHTHVSETEYEVQACRERHNGLTPVRLMNELGLFEQHCIAAHCVWVDDDEIELMAKKKVWVAHNPASNCKLGSGIAPTAKMLARNVRICLGTDGAASNNGLDMIADMRLMSLLQKAINHDAASMNAQDSLKIATVNGANACCFPDAGVIKAGNLADLVLFDPDAENLYPVPDIASAVVFAAQGMNVKTTMVNGTIVYQDGQFTLFDQKAIIREADIMFKKLLA